MEDIHDPKEYRAGAYVPGSHTAEEYVAAICTRNDVGIVFPVHWHDDPPEMAFNMLYSDNMSVYEVMFFLAWMIGYRLHYRSDGFHLSNMALD